VAEYLDGRRAATFPPVSHPAAVPVQFTAKHKR
jgi:hypothetical protein